MATVGKWAFIVGLIIAVIAGFIGSAGTFAWILAIIGLIVGFLNVEESETFKFLLASIALMLGASGIRAIPFIGDIGARIMSNLIIVIACAVLVVGLRALFATAGAGSESAMSFGRASTEEAHGTA